MHPQLAYAASADSDVIYLHQALTQPDREQFLKAMVDEVEGQVNNGNFSIIPREQVPEGERYSQQYGQCVENDGLLNRKCTNGKLASTLIDQSRSKTRISGTQTHR